MGWYSENWRTRRDLIEQLTRSRKHTTRYGPVTTSTCLAHCYRGGAFSCVLWSVWQRTFEKHGVAVKPVKRLIRCDLLRYRAPFGWSVKMLEEATEPFSYSCPMGYLKMVPVANKKWRAGVRTYHKMLKAKKAAHAGASLSISRCMRQPVIWPAGRKSCKPLLPTQHAQLR